MADWCDRALLCHSRSAVTSSRLLARNSALNLFGQVAPLVVALVAMPALVAALGSSRFGVLTLAWALIGYFGLFDFGIARALTQAASEALGRKDEERLAEIGPVSIALMFGLGTIGAVLLCALTPWVVYDLLKMDDSLRPEAARAFYLMAISLPFVLSTAGLRGLLEAHQHFGAATLLRLPYAVFSFLGPVLMLPYSTSVAAIVGLLVVARIATWAAHLLLALKRYPWLRSSPLGNLRPILPLVRMGGWMTVSNVVSPMMVYLDRFLVGALLSLTAVAYYATPYEIVTRLLFVPGAIVGVFFPAFAAAFATDRHMTAAVMDRAARAVIVFMLPAALVFTAFAREGLLVWMGPEYARASTRVVQLLAAGVFINSLGQVVFGLLQATGRADVTAKLHVAELPIYILMIYFFTTRLGLVGVALAWTLRIVLDTAILCWATAKWLPESRPAVTHVAGWTVAWTGTLGLIAMTDALSARVALACVVLLAFSAWAWRIALKPSERAAVLAMIRLAPQEKTAAT